MMKRGLDIDLLDNAIRILASGNCLPEEYDDHILVGEYALECMSATFVLTGC